MQCTDFYSLVARLWKTHSFSDAHECPLKCVGMFPRTLATEDDGWSIETCLANLKLSIFTKARFSAFISTHIFVQSYLSRTEYTRLKHCFLSNFSLNSYILLLFDTAPSPWKRKCFWSFYSNEIMTEWNNKLLLIFNGKNFKRPRHNRWFLR